ncbi:MAG: hypothetical protein QW076_00550 [Candidatus Anstonellales archaeon]
MQVLQGLFNAEGFKLENLFFRNFRSFTLKLFILIFLTNIVFSQQCALVSSGLWMSALIVLAFLLILLALYFISSLEIIASIFDRNQIRTITLDLLGETGLNLLIVLFFTALYFTVPGNPNMFMGLANALPSAFDQSFLQNNYPNIARGPFATQISQQLYSNPGSNYLMTDRPLYLQSARYYVYFMRAMSILLAMTLNFLNAIITLLASISIHFRIKLIGFSISFGNALNPILHAIAVLLQGTNLAVGHWILQSYVIDFIECYSLELLLPLGIVLRLFPFTKPFGNIIISVILGLLVVYPMMLNLNAVYAKQVYGDVNKELTIASITLSNFAYVLQSTLAIYGLHLGFHGLLTFVTSNEFDTLSNASVRGIISRIRNWNFQIGAGVRNFALRAFNFAGEVLGGLLSLFIIYFNISTLMYLSTLIFNVLFQETIFLVVIMSLIWPAINIYVTLLCVKAIAKFLGTDFNLAAIARLL